MTSVDCVRDFKKGQVFIILNDCLQDFPSTKALRKEQEICLVNLVRAKDLFVILPTCFGKSLIF